MSTDDQTYAAAGRAARSIRDALVSALGTRVFSDLAIGCNPELTSRYLAHDFPRAVRAAEEAIADALPALTPADYIKACNGDHAITGEVTRWRDARWSMVDVAAFEAHDRDGCDVWTILRGSSRFEVREVPRYEARHVGGAGQLDAWLVWDNETNEDADASSEITDLGLNDAAEYGFSEEQARALVAAMDRGETCYLVLDTDTGTDARDGDVLDECGHDGYDPTDEDSATEAAAAANIEDYRTNAYGWPFAHNYAAAIDERDADDFHAAGFVVATHEPSGQVYAGIDGGGYDFIEAHWAPLYLRFRLETSAGPYHTSSARDQGVPCIYVPTRDGLRRVVRGDKAGV